MRKLSISIVRVKVDSKAFNSGDNLAARTSRDQWPSYAILEYGLRALQLTVSAALLYYYPIN